MKKNKVQSKGNSNRARSNNNNVKADANTKNKNSANGKNVGFDVEAGRSFHLDEDNDHSFELRDCK